MSSELSQRVQRDINEIFVGFGWIGEGVKIPPEAVRFEICTQLINRAMEALYKIPAFTQAAAEAYFREQKNTEISFSLGDTQYSVSYFKGDEPGQGLLKENFYLIKNGEEKINLTKFTMEKNRINAHISYSNSPPSLGRTQHYGTPFAEEESDRLIKELESVSF